MSTKIRTKISKRNDFYISDYRRRELKYFCLQYPEWKEHLKHIGNIGGTSEWTNETQREAIIRYIYKENMKLIEDTCKEVGGDISEYLFRFVCYEESYVHLSTIKHIPCGRRQFYEKVYEFYYILSQKLLVL